MKRVLALSIIAVFALSWILGTPTVNAGGTASSGDTNGDGLTDLGDAIYLLSYLFGDGPGPVAVDCAGSSGGTIEDEVAAFRASVMGDLQDFAGTTMPLDPDSLKLASTEAGEYMEASLLGLESLSGTLDFFDGVDVSVIYSEFAISIPGGPTLPNGFYRVRLLVDPVIYSTGDPDFGRTFLVDAAGGEFEVPTTTSHFPGTSPVASLGVRTEVCEEAGALRGRRYISCPQLGDILAMSCISSDFLF